VSTAPLPRLAPNEPIHDERRLPAYDAVDRLELSCDPHESIVERHDSHEATLAIDDREAATAASAFAHESQGFLDRRSLRNHDGRRGHDVCDPSDERIPSLPEHAQCKIAIGQHSDGPIELVDHD
jgi:hypothetical protein